MGLFDRKNKKVEQTKKVKKVEEKELSAEELDGVTAAIPMDRSWCPKVDIDMRNLEESSKAKKEQDKTDEHEIEDR